MATAFNTQVGNGKYCLQFETDNKDHYMLIQSLARLCIDRTNIRLIDANSLIEDLEFLAKHEDSFRQSVILGIVHTVKAQKTIDAVEVVRCKDCAVPHNKYTGCPKLNGLATPPDFYCPFGERKDGDD